jgi:hypothetical protein
MTAAEIVDVPMVPLRLANLRSSGGYLRPINRRTGYAMSANHDVW